MKMIPVTLLAISLAGCATMPEKVQAPQVPAPKHHKLIAKPMPSPVIVPMPVPQPAPKPQTFKERFRSTFGHIKWLHAK